MYKLIEGNDLSGKTTTSANLCGSTGFEYRYQSFLPKGENPLYPKVVAMYGILDDVTLGHLFAESIRYDVTHFDPTIESDCVQDSLTLLRSLACHTAYGNNQVVDHLLSIFDDSFPMPHSAVILTARIEVKKERLIKRIDLHPNSVTAADMKIMNNTGQYCAIEEALIHFSTNLFGATVLDTSDMDLSEVLTSVGTILG
jgi:cytidylate kinase